MSFADVISEIEASISQVEEAFDEADFDGKIDEFIETAEEIESRVDEVEELLEELEDDLEEFADYPEEALSGVQYDCDRLGEYWDALDERRDGWADEKLDELRTAVETFGTDVQKAVQDEWEGGVNELVNQSIETTKEKFEESIRKVLDAGDILRDAIRKLYEDLNDEARNEMGGMVKDELKLTIDAAIERLIQEVTDGIMESQLGAQVTAMLSPYIPAIMAARIAVPHVKHAIDVLRMGT